MSTQDQKCVGTHSRLLPSALPWQPGGTLSPVRQEANHFVDLLEEEA